MRAMISRLDHEVPGLYLNLPNGDAHVKQVLRFCDRRPTTKRTSKSHRRNSNRAAG
jgi:hypothetical protein